jgi:hypothetical protein
VWERREKIGRMPGGKGRAEGGGGVKGFVEISMSSGSSGSERT